VIKLYRTIDAWLFAWGSPVPLGLLRIAVGFLAIFNQLFLTFQYREWFTENGFTPRWVAILWLGDYPKLGPVEVPRIDLLSHVTDPRISFAFVAVTVVLSVLLMLGLWTKPVSILLALGITTLQHRSPAILHGGDTVIRLLVIYLAFSPCGLACSVDRLVGLWKGKIAPGPVVAPLWTQRVIQINLAIIYLTTVWIKWGGSQWRNGQATWYPSRLQEFERFWVPEFMRQFPMVWVTTYGTILVEFAMVSLVFYRPYRKWILGMAVMMHLYIDYSMNIPLFSWLMICQYICFYDADEIRGWAGRVGQRLSRWRMQLPLPDQRPGEMAAIEATDPFDLVTFVPGESPSPRQMRQAWFRSPGAWWLPIIPRKLKRST
jgi:uncharacterized membrane protein YphA (DoxX/SURF4 family)